MTQQDTKIKLNKLLQEDVVLFFENVEITGELTEFLFSNEQIKKVYFIRYKEALVQKIKDTISNKEIIAVNNLTKNLVTDLPVIYCLNNSNYFNPNYSIIAKDKNIKGMCFLGFPESPFSIKPSSREITIVHHQLMDFLQPKISFSSPSSEIDLSGLRKFFNRQSEIRKLVTFLADGQARLLVIHGFPGLGKTSLVDELRRIASNRKYFYFTFQDSLDTYKDIINELSPFLSFSFQQEDWQRSNTVAINFNKRFSELQNITLVFDATEKVLENREFISEELMHFFERLITYENFSATNKIIFLSKAPFTGNYQIRPFKEEIHVKELLPYYIKEVMGYEYTNLNKPELAIKINSLNDETINQAICGHPALALRFVDASLIHGIDEILNNSEFNSKVGSEIKLKWLLDNYPLDEIETNVLENTGLFNDEVPRDYLKSRFPDSHLIIEKFTARYLFDAKTMKDGSIKYYVPTLIKDYILGITSPEIIRKNHLEIGNYFWEKAEDIKATSFQKISAYRRAFHHYNSSGDRESIKLLVMRFKEKFLMEAWKHARERNWNDAFFFFNELHINNQIGLANARDYNEFLKVIKKMPSKPPNADNLVDEIHSLFPRNSFIAVSYADYLFDKGLYQQSADECLRIKKLDKISDHQNRHNQLTNTIIDTTLAKCYYKLGKPVEAEEILSNWKEHFYRKGLANLNEQEKYHFQALIMTQFRGQDDFEVYQQLKNTIVHKVESGGTRFTGIPFMRNNLTVTYCLAGEQEKKIKEQFEKALNIRTDEKIRRSYENFHAHIISPNELIDYIASAERNNPGNQPDIASEVKAIDELINKSKSLLDEVRNIDPRHFQSNYSLVSLMQVEADFYLLKQVLRGFIYE